MLARNLILSALGVLVLAALCVSYARSSEQLESLRALADVLESSARPETAAPETGPAGTKNPFRGPTVQETRFFEDPHTLTRIVSRFPDEYRILSCGRDTAHGFWRVRYERPEPASAAAVAMELRRYLAGELDESALRIDYRQVHFGETSRHGAQIAVLGTGELRENVFSSGRGVHMVPRHSVRELVELIMELEAWQQYILAERPAGTRDTIATLEISAGSARSRVWELPRYRRLDDRIERVAQRMKRLAWADEHIVIIGDE